MNNVMGRNRKTDPPPGFGNKPGRPKGSTSSKKSLAKKRYLFTLSDETYQLLTDMAGSGLSRSYLVEKGVRLLADDNWVFCPQCGKRAMYNPYSLAHIEITCSCGHCFTYEKKEV